MPWKQVFIPSTEKTVVGCKRCQAAGTPHFMRIDCKSHSASPTGILKHFKNAHEDEPWIKEYENQCEEKRAKGAAKQEKEAKQQTRISDFFEVDTKKHKAATAALVDLILATGLPPNIVEHAGWKKFLAILVPGYTPPGRNAITKRCDTKAQLMIDHARKQLRDHVEAGGKYAAVSDGWSSRYQKMGFDASMAFYITPDWVLRSCPMTLVPYE